LEKLTSELEGEYSEVPPAVNTPILKSIGSMVFGCLDQISHDLMCDEKFQTFVVKILFNENDNSSVFKKEVFFILSNVFASKHVENAEFITESSSLLNQICLIALKSDYPVRKEALVALFNLGENHNSQFLSKLLQEGALEAFTSVLTSYQHWDPYHL
jgi:hypothetical protein